MSGYATPQTEPFPVSRVPNSRERLDQSIAMPTMRPILPKEEGSKSPPAVNSVEPAPAHPNKRRCISSACLPCRRRKSKCDGAFPACSTCKAVYQMECVYNTDADPDRRRRGSLKRDIEELREKTDSLDALVARIRSAPEPELAGIIANIRTGSSTSTKPPTVHPESHEDPSSISHDFRTSTLMIDALSDMRNLGHGSNHELIDGSRTERKPRELNNRQRVWTTVTRDAGFISELLALYFTWYHPIYVLFSKSCFLADMTRERLKYCSPLLVNAILALACHFSDRPEARANPSDASTVGDHFFAEAKQHLLLEEAHPNLTLVQGLLLMSLREVNCGRDSLGWMYMGRAVQAALDLGLHLPIETGGDERGRISPTETEVRKITFWGLFLLDKLWAVRLGRVPQLPSSIVGVAKPNALQPVEEEPWPPYPNIGHDYGVTVPGHVHAISTQQVELAEILGDALWVLYAPREQVTLAMLRDSLGRLEHWKTMLPAFCRTVTAESVPAVMFMHMLHQSSIIALFRPFMHMDLIGLPAHPRDICRNAATSICQTFALYRRRHPLRYAVAMVVHMLLFASTVFLLDLPSPTSEAALVQCVLGIRELKSWHLGQDTLQVVHSLAEKWGVTLPPSVTGAFRGYEAPETEELLQPLPLSINVYEDTLGTQEPEMEAKGEDNRIASWVDDGSCSFGNWGTWAPPSFAEATTDVRRYSYAESGIFC